uniref:Uncharacterized protein n=1 Tax=Anguilla anguilla TaxID=7936 RepID=A0A0E9QC17_ANGAN
MYSDPFTFSILLHYSLILKLILKFIFILINRNIITHNDKVKTGF